MIHILSKTELSETELFDKLEIITGKRINFPLAFVEIRELDPY